MRARSASAAASRLADLGDHRLRRLGGERRRCRASPGLRGLLLGGGPVLVQPGPLGGDVDRAAGVQLDARPRRPRRAWRVAAKPSPAASSRASDRISGSCAASRRRPRPSSRAATRWPGRSPWSERNRRTSVTTRCSAATSASAASSTRYASAAGQAAVTHRLAAGQRRPQLLGDERDHRVQQPQQLVQHVPEHPAGGLGGRAALGEHRLGQLEVPVADLVPGEVVERVADLGELERLERARRPRRRRAAAGTGSSGPTVDSCSAAGSGARRRARR